MQALAHGHEYIDKGTLLCRFRYASKTFTTGAALKSLTISETLQVAGFSVAGFIKDSIIPNYAALKALV